MSIYLLLFPLLAFFAAETGNFTEAIWWILLPTWPILYPFVKLRSIMSLLRKSLVKLCSIAKRMGRSLSQSVHIYIPASILLIVGLWFLGKILFALSRTPPALPTKPSPLVDLITLIFVWIVIGGGVIIWIVSGLVRVSHLVRDWSRWHQWFGVGRKVKTCQELWEAIGNYYNISFCIHAIQNMQKQRMLIINDQPETFFAEIEVFLRRVILEIEIRQQNQKAPKYTGECRMLVSKANPESLDELSKFLEYIQTARRNLHG